MEIWYNFHSKNKGEHTVNQDTVTISRAEYEELRKANDELRQANEDLSKQVSFLMQQITKCRTRIRKWTICTSDKLKGQLKGCPLNMPGIMLEGLSLLRNSARMTLTGTLVMIWIRSLIHWHTRINSTLGIRLFFRKSKANIL